MAVSSIQKHLDTAAQFFASSPVGQTISFITGLWNRVQLAYNESSKDAPAPLKLSNHYTPERPLNPHKKTPWPDFLDSAWGKWDPFGFYDAYQEHARKAEPNELVTPLHANTLGTNYEGIYRNIANVADVNAPDIRGQTPAYWAAYYGNLKALTILTIFGANLSFVDKRDKEPVRAAAKYGHDDIITFLASQKISLNRPDGRRSTPLHIAAYHNRFSTYQQLILLGADQTIMDLDGRTAEDILKQRYAINYHSANFFQRLFMSPTPPPLMLKPFNIQKLSEARSKT